MTTPLDDCLADTDAILDRLRGAGVGLAQDSLSEARSASQTVARDLRSQVVALWVVARGLTLKNQPVQAMGVMDVLTAVFDLAHRVAPGPTMVEFLEDAFDWPERHPRDPVGVDGSRNGPHGPPPCFRPADGHPGPFTDVSGVVWVPTFDQGPAGFDQATGNPEDDD